MPLILEGLVTTLDDSGGVNVSPMGPIVDPQMQRLLLRPFPTSTTYGNLRRHGEGVFHVTDDVEMLARGGGRQAHAAASTAGRARRAGPDSGRRLPVVRV